MTKRRHRRRERTHRRGARLFCRQRLRHFAAARRPWPPDLIVLISAKQCWWQRERNTLAIERRGFCCRRMMPDAANRCRIHSSCKLDKVECHAFLGELFFFFWLISWIYLVMCWIDRVVDCVGWIFFGKSQTHREVPTHEVESLLSLKPKLMSESIPIDYDSCRAWKLVCCMAILDSKLAIVLEVNCPHYCKFEWANWVHMRRWLWMRHWGCFNFLVALLLANLARLWFAKINFDEAVTMSGEQYC